MGHGFRGYVSHNQGVIFFVFKRSYGFDKDTLWQSMASWEIIYRSTAALARGQGVPHRGKAKRETQLWVNINIFPELDGIMYRNHLYPIGDWNHGILNDFP